jgi:sugar phosphate isomerase/epimerase
MNRRQFTGGLAAAAAGLALGRRVFASDAPNSDAPKPDAQAPKSAPSSVVGGVEIGVQSFTFRAFDLDRMIDATRSIGISSVELWSGHLDPMTHSEVELRAARAKIEAAGLRVSAYSVNFKLDASAEVLERAFRGAGLLGTSLMTTSTEKSMVPRLDECARKHGVTIGLHNHWLGDAWFKGDRAQNFESPDDLLGALRGRSEHIAINLDIGHLSAAGYDPLAFFEAHHDRIISLHVKDRDQDAAHTLRAFGRGATPIAAVLKLAQRVKFRYAANIEWEKDQKDPSAGVRDSLAYMKRALGG